MKNFTDLLKTTADKFEVYYLEQKEKSISFKGNKLSDAGIGHEKGYAIRLIKKGKTAFSVTDSVDNPKKLVTQLNELANLGVKEPLEFHNQVVPKESLASFYSPNLENFDPAELIPEAEKAIASLTADGKTSVNLGIGTSSEHVHLVNSAGFDQSYKKNGASLSILAERSEPGNLLMIPISRQLTNPKEHGILEMVEALKERLHFASKTVSFKTGTYPVIFAPSATSDVLVALLSGLSGMSVALETSPLTKKLGEKILSPKITITDNPLIPGSSRSLPFDDEGITAQKRVLIENGVLKSHMHSLRSAALTNTAPTGHGFRIKRIFESKDLRTRPRITASNLEFNKGNTSLESMISSIDNGVFAEYVTGSFIGNVINGDFSATLWLGYQIRNGKIVGRIKNALISGNIYDLLNQQLICLSDKIITPVEATGYYLPHLQCDNVSISCG